MGIPRLEPGNESIMRVNQPLVLVENGSSYTPVILEWHDQLHHSIHQTTYQVVESLATT
jgi:hypothetical protein